jgi:hypothetical protein
MVFKNGIKNIQAAAYDGTSSVYVMYIYHTPSLHGLDIKVKLVTSKNGAAAIQTQVFKNTLTWYRQN